MSAQVQEAIKEYERAITEFCTKYSLSDDIKRYIITCGLNVKKTRLTTNTRTILATLYHKYKEIGALSTLRRDVKATFKIADSIFDDLKKRAGLKADETLNLKDESRSLLNCKFCYGS